MTCIKIVFLMPILYTLSCVTFAAAAEEEFPKIGFAKDNGSNVRAGDNINYEILCELKKGDPVKIIGERYSWFKIILPKRAYLYIKNDYVELDTETMTGVLNAVRVNLRAGPSTKYSILGQISEPQEVKIISEVDGWYKIEPPEDMPGWIHASQVNFEFELVDTPEPKKEKIEATEEEIKETSPVIQKKESTSIMLELGVPEPKGNLIFSTQGN